VASLEILADARLGALWAAPPSIRTFRPLEDHDLHRGAALRPDQRALGHRQPINGELFTLYVEKVLAPTLTRGEVVILDNLGSHKGKQARDAIRATGAHLLFLPPYSPDLNPIEQAMASGLLGRFGWPPTLLTFEGKLTERRLAEDLCG
jgi:hypothetical protein